MATACRPMIKAVGPCRRFDGRETGTSSSATSRLESAQNRIPTRMGTNSVRLSADPMC
jgi:hypothetical protein